MFSWLTYLSEDCVKQALDNAGKERVRPHIWTGLDQSLATACRNIATEPIPEELLERTETAQLVQMTLASIPHRYSNILTDHYCKMNTTGQIAEAIGKDELAVTAMLYQGRLAFKAAFTRLAAWLKPDEAKG
jgi:DNA-directed RNA polymerase specialized sigma24 family protein